MKKALIIAAVVFTTAGCMTVDISASLETPVSMTGTVQEDYVVVRHFEKTAKAWFTLFDLITMKNPDFSLLIEGELKRTPGDAVINVEVKGQTTVIDGLIPVAMSVAGNLLGQTLASDPYYGAVYGSVFGAVSGAMLTARTYTISGDIIKYKISVREPA